MAQKKGGVGNAPTVQSTNKRPTADEIKSWYEQYSKEKSNFDKAEEALKNLRDVSKSTIYRTVDSFNKEELRNYLQTVSSNEVNLRNLSRYLYYRSQVY